MKLFPILSALFLALLLSSCGGNDINQVKEKKNKPKSMLAKDETKEVTTTESDEVAVIPASAKVDLVSKGVGPIKSVELSSEINQGMVSKGMEVYKAKCTACHKVDKRLVGPSPAGIMSRRTPEWIMNMILNPEGMVKEDELAKELFMEFNGSPMSNQNLTQEEARSILEYFRTL